MVRILSSVAFQRRKKYSIPTCTIHANTILICCVNCHAVKMVDIINQSLPTNAGIVRIHVAGDFFSQQYMEAWYTVALLNPKILFYAYTKSLRYWLNIREFPVLHNFVLTASYGGTHDHLIDEFNLRSTKVVFSEAEAEELGLAIDHDDSHAAKPSLRDNSFALLIHRYSTGRVRGINSTQKIKGER